MRIKSFAALLAAGALYANINFPPDPNFIVGQFKEGSLIIGCAGSTVLYSSSANSFTVGEIAQPNPTTRTYRVTAVSAGSATITINISSPAGCTNPPPPIFNFPVIANGGATPTFPATFHTNNFTSAFNHPISAATGENFGHDDDADLLVRGPIDLVLRRYSASYLSGNGIRSALGTNWMHNFDMSLSISTAPTPGGSTTTAVVKLFRGDTVAFTRSGNVFTVARERVNYQLVASGTDFRFYSPVSNLIYTFNSTGALTRIEDRNGNALTVTQGPNGPTQMSDGLGRTLTFTYTGARLTRVQDQAGRTVSYDYAGELLSNFTDANGKRSTFNYTAVGNITGLITGERRPAGNTPFSQEYDAQGRVARQLDSRANAMTMTYNVTPGTTGIAHPLNVTSSVTHDAQRNTTRITDANGQSANYTYDPNDRPTALVDRLGNRTTATYDAASGRPTSYSDEEGNTTTYSYTASTSAEGFTFHDLTGIRNPDGTTVGIARDQRGNITSVTDESGRVWRLTRNSRGQVETLTTPAGGVTTFTYGADGTLTSVRSDPGDTSTLAYDNAKRANVLTHPDNNTARFTYDARDNVTRSTDERGNARSLTLNDNNNPLRVTDALNAPFAVTYDNDDRVASSLDANGRASLFTYDAVGRLATAANAAGDRVTLAYDGLNRPTTITDAAGKADTFSWDRENRLMSLTDALGRVTRFTRDRRGLVTRVTTPNNENYDYGYDSRGRRTLATNPLGETTQFRYDRRGSLEGVTRAGGINASIERNEIGLITRVIDPNGHPWQRNFDRLGRMASSTDPLGRIVNYEYDSRQRLVRSILPVGPDAPAPSTVQFTYDAAGNLTRQLYSDGTDIPSTYDNENRLLTSFAVTLGYDRNGDITNSNGLTIERDAARRIAAITYASGKVLRYTYDNRGLVTRITDWVGGFTEIEYNDARQVTSIRYPNAFRREFTYDRNGRVATIRFVRLQAAGEIVLRRDGDGKVVSADRTARYIPDPANGYLPHGYDAAHQSAASTYDTLGRVTADGPRTYEWDLASRLKSYSGADGSAQFAYDGLGQRVGRTSAGVSQAYVWNYATPLPTIATIRQGGADVRYFVWLPDGRLLYSVEATGNARRFFHFDETGSTILVTDDAAAVVDAVATTPYGETVQRTGTFDNPFTWQGEFGVMQEGATGLFYMRARWYDSASARFLSKDPVASLDPRQMSPYQYARANPMRYSDASGLRDKPNVEIFGGYSYLRADDDDPGSIHTLVGGNAPLNRSNSSYPDFARLLPFGRRSPETFSVTQLFDTPAFNTGVINLSGYAPPQFGNFWQPEGRAPQATYPIPRFADTSTATNISRIDVCRTNLLFPFVTNQAGFDTGLAISQTSQDPFGTGVQTGACRLNYFGSTTSANASPRCPSNVESPGGGESFVLSTGGALGVTGGPGFQGYIIAQCQFQYAHGFAFISDLGAQRLAQGYLALVLDGAVDRTNSASEVLGQ